MNSGETDELLTCVTLDVPEVVLEEGEMAIDDVVNGNGIGDEAISDTDELTTVDEKDTVSDGNEGVAKVWRDDCSCAMVDEGVSVDIKKELSAEAAVSETLAVGPSVTDMVDVNTDSEDTIEALDTPEMGEIVVNTTDCVEVIMDDSSAEVDDKDSVPEVNGVVVDGEGTDED